MRKAGVFILVILLLVNLGFSFFLLQKIQQVIVKEEKLYTRLERVEKSFLKVNLDEPEENFERKLLKNYREKVYNSINESINSLVKEKPVLGATRWYVTGIKLLEPDIAYVNYEDGHIGGAMMIRLISLEENNWEVIYRFNSDYIFENELWNIDWDWKR